MHPLPRSAHGEEDGERQAEGGEQHARADERDEPGRRMPRGVMTVIRPVVVMRLAMRTMIAMVMPGGGRIRRPGGGRRAQREEPVDEETEEREHRDEPREARDRVSQGVPRGGEIGMHQPLSRVMSSRCTVWRCRKIEMMIARPTAASAAATVITMITKTWPVAP